VPIKTSLLNASTNWTANPKTQRFNVFFSLEPISESYRATGLHSLPATLHNTGDISRIKPVRLDLPTPEAWKAEFMWESLSHIPDTLVLK